VLFGVFKEVTPELFAGRGKANKRYWKNILSLKVKIKFKYLSTEIKA
jgi:hypothetical protein